MVEDALVSADVEAAQKLVRLLDKEGMQPKAALWVFSSDHGGWRLWLVPSSIGRGGDVREIYLRIAKVISHNREALQNLDIGDVEVLDENHDAIKALSGAFRIEGLGSVHISNNRLNDIFLPEAIIIRFAV